MPWITMSTGCGGSLFSVRYFPNGSPFCLPEIRTTDNERDMDKIKICEAMYALPGEVVVRRRKSLVLPAALLAAGVAILVLNHVYGASMTNNLRSSAVFIGGSLALAGMITLAARFFIQRRGRALLPCRTQLPALRRTLLRAFPEPRCGGPRGGRQCGTAAGNAPCACSGGLRGHVPYARQPLRRHAGLRVRGPGIPAADPVADQPAERGGLRGVGFVAALRDRNCAR